MGEFLKDPVFLATVLGTTLPFFSMAAILILTRSNPGLSSKISLAAISTSAACALYLLVKLHSAPPVQFRTLWFTSGNLNVTFGYYLDSLSLLMLTIVGVISCLVQVYSVGYMAGDPGCSRYYAFQSLFAWAMMNNVIAGNMLQLFVFWELVGLASYFLIGFYYEKWSASQAGKKAFVMNRVGDVGFLLGLIFLLIYFGNLEIPELNHAAATHGMPRGLITVSALLFFCGVIGKSAQFPLLTWLPDAMEGPTPVSALLHSATMVAAGVYMFSRIFPFFSVSPDAMEITLAVGTVTMLLSATMAIVSYDVKAVWAYSTISQLGMMVMALGAGGYFAGVYHLTTHAGFKALLFLCSGIFIHEFHTNDMRIIGRQGGRRLKIPMVCMTIGALALSGVFPFSGFFSKEAILAVLAAHPNKTWVAAGLLGTVFTAYYSFRLIFLILFPEGGIAGKAHGPHADSAQGNEDEHPGYIFWTMAIPVMVLAGATMVLGFVENPLRRFLDRSIQTLAVQYVAGHEGMAGRILILGSCAGLFGIALSWFEFGRKGAGRIGFVGRFPAVWKLFDRRWFLDDFFRKSLDTVVYGGLSRLSVKNDNRVIDGGIDGICHLTEGVGRRLSFLQSGMLQYNLLVMLLGAGAAIILLLV